MWWIVENEGEVCCFFARRNLTSLNLTGEGNAAFGLLPGVLARPLNDSANTGRPRKLAHRSVQ